MAKSETVPLEPMKLHTGVRSVRSNVTKTSCFYNHYRKSVVISTTTGYKSKLYE